MAATTAAAAQTRPRQHLVRAQKLLLSRNLNGARHAYTLALTQSQCLGSFDLSACFVCHVRLAQLSLLLQSTTVDGDPRAVAQEHLKSAWALMDHLAPPLTGALGCYFRGVGLKLAGLFDESRESKRAAAVRRRLEGLGLVANTNSIREESACGGETISSAAAEIAAVALPGCGSEAETGKDCDGCGRATKGSPAYSQGWYCLDCTDAYNKAVAQVSMKLRRCGTRALVFHPFSTPLQVPPGYPPHPLHPRAPLTECRGPYIAHPFYSLDPLPLIRVQ